MPLAKKILMGQKELARMSAMEKAQERNMTLPEAAAGLQASCRQAKRIVKTELLDWSAETGEELQKTGQRRKQKRMLRLAFTAVAKTALSRR
jgi:hypothetical protein